MYGVCNKIFTRTTSLSERNKFKREKAWQDILSCIMMWRVIPLFLLYTSSNKHLQLITKIAVVDENGTICAERWARRSTNERACVFPRYWMMDECLHVPPSLDKEPSDCDTRHCFTKRAHAAIAARRSCRYNESSFAFFSFSSFSFLSSSFSFSSSSVSQRGVVVTTYRKNRSDSRLAATQVALRNILWGSCPFKEHANVRTREISL